MSVAMEQLAEPRTAEHATESRGVSHNRVQNQPPHSPQQTTTAVTVSIYDQTYHLRGQDPAYIASLAEVVDSKMRAVAAGGTTVDSLRVAVLAALNIADEMMRIQEKYSALTGSFTQTESSLRDRTASLSGLLDSILSEDRKIG
jgi:cell division protein ZapA